jgi:hypothetical protein
MQAAGGRGAAIRSKNTDASRAKKTKQNSEIEHAMARLWRSMRVTKVRIEELEVHVSAADDAHNLHSRLKRNKSKHV